MYSPSSEELTNDRIDGLAHKNHSTFFHRVSFPIIAAVRKMGHLTTDNG